MSCFPLCRWTRRCSAQSKTALFRVSSGAPGKALSVMSVSSVTSLFFPPFSLSIKHFAQGKCVIPHQWSVAITQCFCCPQPSGMWSLRSWMQSSLRSLSTEEEARSFLQPGEWCTLLSSWWDHPALSLFFSSSSISSSRLPFHPHFL